MGGGKGEIDISITGGGDPQDDYIHMREVLPDDFPVFDDGAGEVEEFIISGGEQNIFYDDPYWYFQSTFTLGTMPGTDGYFGFSDTVHYIPEQRQSSLGAVLVEGDHYIDFTNDRIYSWGGVGSPDPGSQPIATTFVHLCEKQFTISGAGPIVLYENHYANIGEPGVKRIGSFQPTYRTEGGINTTAIGRIQVFNFLNGLCYGFALNPPNANQAGETPSEKGRGGFYWSDDDGVTWHRSTGSGPWEYQPHGPIPAQGSQEGDQPLNAEPAFVRYPNPLPPPVDLFYDWNLDGSEVSYGSSRSEMTDVTNATTFNAPTGRHGWVPMTGDGVFGMFFTRKNPGNFWSTGKVTLEGDIVDPKSYGKHWRNHGQIPYHQRKVSYFGNGDIPGNSLNLEAICRDARGLVDPLTYGGFLYGITRQRQVLLFDVDVFTWLGGGPSISSPNLLAQLPGVDHSANTITSTFDEATGKMWLHAFTRYNNVGGALWGFYYSRSDDGGASWSTVNFPAVHDPWWGHANWRFDGEAKHMHTIQFLTSPESRTLWLSMYSQQSFGFLSYRYIASHLFRSLDHGVTWDKITGNAPFYTGQSDGTRGWSRGADGYYRRVGSPSPVFLGNPVEGPPTEFYIFAEMYGYEQIYHFKTNLTGSHGDALDSITFPAYDEEPHIDGNPDEYGGWSVRGLLNILNPGSSHGTFLDNHSPNYDANLLPCGFQRHGTIIQKINDYYFRTGGFGKESTCTNWGSSNTRDRGDYIEFSLLPTDAVLDNICDEAGFIIRAPHVNTLRTKLTELNSNVRTGGTNKINFGIDLTALTAAGLPVTAHKNHIRAPHYASLVGEFINIVGQVGIGPGGEWYTDDIDLADEYLDLLFAPSAGDAPSIRTLIAMRKIIQNLYTDGFFCACYSFCPCQSDVSVSGGGSKK